VLVIALLLGNRLDTAIGAARDTERAWRPIEGIWVAAVDLDAGATIAPGDVAVTVLPAAALPRDPVPDSPVGRRLRDPLAAGEIIRVGRLTDGAGGPLVARLPADHGGLRLRTPAPHLRVGDLVDLYTLLDGERVAARAEVVSLDEDLPTVAVATGDLPAVIRALTTGDVVPVVVG
jgi:SAF domain